MVSCALSLLLCACTFPVNVGNGKTVRCTGEVQTRNLELKGFDKIVINGSADLTLIQQEDFRVSVEANEEVFGYLDYHVEDGTLMLETVDHVNVQAKKFQVTVTLPRLLLLEVNGAADADLKGGYCSTDKLRIEVNGAGDLDFNDIQVSELSIEVNGAGDIDATSLDVTALRVEVNGAGDVTLSGKADKASFSVSGVGDIDARGLDCGSTEIHKSGVASIRTK